MWSSIWRDSSEVTVSRREIRDFVEEFQLKNGRRVYLLGEGRLINLASAEGHPSSVMDMSFANQALADRVSWSNTIRPWRRKVYPVPAEIDQEIARMKLLSMGIQIDQLTKEQEALLGLMGERNMKDQEPLNASIEKDEKEAGNGFFSQRLVVLAGLALYRGWGFTQKRSGTQRAARMEVPVQVTPVVSKPLTYSMKVTGDILPLMQVDLFPKVSGYLERIDVHIGDIVKQGQVIAQIDRTDFLQKVREIEAKVAQAKAQLAEIETGTRTEELRQAEEAVKQAQSRFENARLQHERIEALYQERGDFEKGAGCCGHGVYGCRSPIGIEPATSEASSGGSPPGSQRGKPGEAERDGGDLRTGEDSPSEYKDRRSLPGRDQPKICGCRSPCLPISPPLLW